MTSLRHLKPMLKAWSAGALISVGIIGLLLAVSPFVLPESDSMALYRYFLLRVGAAAWGIVAITGGALFFDHVTPGNWLERIEEGNAACAIVTVGVIVTLGLMLCYI